MSMIREDGMDEQAASPEDITLSTTMHDVKGAEQLPSNGAMPLSATMHPNSIQSMTQPVDAANRKMLPMKKANSERRFSNSSTDDDLPRPENLKYYSLDHAYLDIEWKNLSNLEFFADGGNNWLYSGHLNGKNVVVKTIKPKCANMYEAIIELEREVEIHAKLSHENIVQLSGAGLTTAGQRFIVLERLDGGTLSQMLVGDAKTQSSSRFWKPKKIKKKFSYMEILTHARSLARALHYCHSQAIPGCMVIHRDLKPENIAFSSDCLLKLLDFGLTTTVEDSSPDSEEDYEMSGKTGSFRYMSPEVGQTKPYNHKADVYSYGLILWAMTTQERPYEGMNYGALLTKVWKGKERPVIKTKWPKDWSNLLEECWR